MEGVSIKQEPIDPDIVSKGSLRDGRLSTDTVIHQSPETVIHQSPDTVIHQSPADVPLMMNVATQGSSNRSVETDWIKHEPLKLEVPVSSLDKQQQSGSVDIKVWEDRPIPVLMVPHVDSESRNGDGSTNGVLAKESSEKTEIQKAEDKKLSAYMKHITNVRRRADEKPHKCRFCPFGTDKKSDVKWHERRHTNKRAHKCRFCTYSSSHEGKVWSHEMIHPEHSLYKRSNLEESGTQGKMHPGVKRYKCSFCPYRAEYKCELVMHERIHTGDKPYKCPLCPFRTALNKYLVNHARIHRQASDEPSTCSRCSYTCRSRAELLVHERAHNRPQKCLLCSFSTTSKRQLTEHEKTKHPEVQFSYIVVNPEKQEEGKPTAT